MARALAASPRLTALYAAPGNPGIAAVATCLALSDHAAIVAACREHGIGLVVVGPEVPLVAGLVDALRDAGIPAFGPTAAAARLEASKGFTKDFCARHGIPTAAYRRVGSRMEAHEALAAMGAPIVVKADGLAAGKGVTVADTLAEAEAALDAIFAEPRASAQDHKRVGEGDTGPNTGGMGAVSPARILDAATQARVMREIVEPTMAGMAAEGAPFSGVLFAGLMLTASGPQLIEYNVRFGDPETQAMLPRLQDDLLDWLLACAQGRLPAEPPRFSDETAVCVVLAATGYPGAARRGGVIAGLERVKGVTHAGTAMRADGALVAAGGRVLAVTALGRSAAEAREAAYDAVALVDWPDGFHRRDIGLRAVVAEFRARYGDL